MTREWNDLEDYNNKYQDRESLVNFVSVMNFFESIGGLLKKGMIDHYLVYEILPTNVNTYWESMMTCQGLFVK